MAYTKNATVDSWDTAKQLEYYKANPAEAQQEIARANSVGGAAASNWASQLQGGIPAPKPATNNSTPYSSGSGYNYGSSYTPSNTPAPSAVYAPAPTYQSSAPSYSAPTYNTPAPAASSYTGSSSIIGSVNGSNDLNKSYQSIYDSVRASDPSRNQINTWGDSKGNVYDTTKMTPQQIFALSLSKDGNSNAAAILKGMGLDMNGNPTSPGGSMNANSGTVYAPPSGNSSQGSAMSSPYTKNTTVDSMPIDQQLAYYSKNPQEAQQEIARAQGVGGAAAQSWADQLRGIIPQSSYTPTSQGGGQGNVPTTNQNGGAVQLPNGAWAPGNNVYGLGNDQYAALQAQANASSAADIASQTTIANQQKAGYQNSYNQMNQQTNDNRSLENFKNSQLLNPFNGYSDYAQGQINRERAITDRQNQQDLQSKLGNVDAQLADYAKSSTAKKQEIVTQLAKDLSSYQMQVEQLKLQQGDLALKSQNQQFNQQQDIKKQHIDLASFLTQQYGVPVNPTDDPMMSYAQVAGIPTVAAQKIAMDAANMSFDNAVKKALAENTINKTQADILQQAQQISISQQNANTSAASASSSAQNAKDRLSWDKDPKNPDNIYKMSQSNKPKTTDYKTDPNFASDVSHLKASPTDAAKLDSNPQPFIDAYGYDGYLALRKAAGIDD